MNDLLRFSILFNYESTPELMPSVAYVRSMTIFAIFGTMEEVRNFYQPSEGYEYPWIIRWLLWNKILNDHAIPSYLHPKSRLLRHKNYNIFEDEVLKLLCELHAHSLNKCSSKVHVSCSVCIDCHEDGWSHIIIVVWFCSVRGTSLSGSVDFGYCSYGGGVRVHLLILIYEV